MRTPPTRPRHSAAFHCKRCRHGRRPTIRPAAIDPLTGPRVVTLGQIPVVVARSATALRARPQTVRDQRVARHLQSQAGQRRLAGQVPRPGPLPAVSVGGRGREDSVPEVSGPGGGLGAAAVPEAINIAGRARRWDRPAGA